MTDFHHIPVLLDAVVDALAIRPDGLYVDCTAGGGGHARAIGEQLSAKGRLIALDRDADAVAAARRHLDGLACQHEVVHAPFSQLEAVLAARGITGKVDGILADLGVSSHQIDEAERGFSFQHDGPLDMRMDRRQPTTAADLVNTLDPHDLADVLFQLGDERQSRRIASAIARRREQRPFERTADLADFIEEAVGGRRGSRIHPATRSFQALRIHINDEFGQLDELLRTALRLLEPGGRLAVITFHSGEDRRVKQLFALLRRDCICEPRGPVCTCGWEPLVKVPRGKGVTATDEERATNSRSRSARLRFAVRTDHPWRALPQELARA